MYVLYECEREKEKEVRLDEHKDCKNEQNNTNNCTYTIRIRILVVYVPTGTKKFLSVEQIIASTRPTTQARFKSLQVCSHCNPYALLITWFIVYRAHNLPISSIESGTRGAKHDVVLIIANTRVEYCSISSFIACISVTT